MHHTTRLLTVAGVLGALGIGGALFLHGQSQPAAAATMAIDSAVQPAASTTAPPRGFMGRHGPKLDEAATLLGISTDDLKKEIQSGKPFYQIAAEHGITYDKLKASAQTEMKTKLDDMVKVGFMTQAQADDILAKSADQPMLGMEGMHGLGMGMMH